MRRDVDGERQLRQHGVGIVLAALPLVLPHLAEHLVQVALAQILRDRVGETLHESGPEVLPQLGPDEPRVLVHGDVLRDLGQIVLVVLVEGIPEPVGPSARQFAAWTQ